MLVLVPFQKLTLGGSSMIAESKSYLGVPCLRCGERIVVSAKVVSIQAEIENGELNAPHAFVARSRMCEYESVYEIKGCSDV